MFGLWLRLPRPGDAVSVVASGPIRWRSLLTGETGHGGMNGDHADVAELNRVWQHEVAWLKGCTCADCDRARGANDDEQ